MLHMFHSELIPGRSKFVVWWCVSLSMRLSKWLLVYLHETRIKIGMKKKGIDNLYYLATLRCDAMPGGDVRPRMMANEQYFRLVSH